MNPKHREIPRNILFLILTAAILVLADLTGYLSGYKNIRNYFGMPFTTAARYISTTLGYTTNSIVNSRKLKEENLELRQKILLLDNIITQAEENREFSDSLEKSLNEAKRIKYKKVISSEILTMKYSNLTGKILLNRGEKDGIKVGMPVAIGNKYVGYIEETYLYQSLCKSYLVPDQEFVGYIPRNKVTGILHTTVNYIKFQDLLATDKVNLQDSVKIKQDGYPYYFEIGKVISIPRKEGSAEKIAHITSTLDLEKYYFVTIIIK